MMQGAGVEPCNAQGGTGCFEGEGPVRVGAEDVPGADYPVVAPGAVLILRFQQEIHAAAECPVKLSGFAGEISGILAIGITSVFPLARIPPALREDAGTRWREKWSSAGGTWVMKLLPHQRDTGIL